ncbi:MAG: sugar transferase [Nitrospinae bacterium]|nr:sugar transferase [Nitrospinota bacterium]
MESISGCEKFSALESGRVLSRRQYLCKRVLDLGFSITVLFLFAPLGLLIAIIIKLVSEGPIFYSQVRVTQGGRLFTLYKFRTMRVDTDQPLGTMSTKENDPRIYSFGRFLRRCHLDEFPQLWNVIKGDMSIVGPRAEYIKTLEIAKKHYPEFAYRELVPAGITGWAQIRQGHVDQIEDYRIKLEHDLYYILNYSFWMDLQVVFLTMLTLLRMRRSGV